MKTIVSLQDLLEGEIKPRALIERYYSEVRAAIPQYFPAGSLRDVESPCPGGGAGIPAFEKWGFQYRECQLSGSLFVSPRPDEAALIRYYRESPAARFWHDQVLAETESARLAKLTQPRVDWVLSAIAESGVPARTLLDLSTSSRDLLPGLVGGGIRSAVAAGATSDLEIAEPVDAIEVRPGTLADARRLGQFDVITALEALDRTHDVAEFEHTMYELLRPGGLLFLTAPTSSGFELQILWDRSPTIVPPDKLNILSVEGLQSLFCEPRWEIIELSTPGVLDLETVSRTVNRNPSGDWPRFVRYLVQQRDDDAHHDFQLFLQRFRLTSFARLVVRRRT